MRRDVEDEAEELLTDEMTSLTVPSTAGSLSGSGSQLELHSIGHETSSLREMNAPAKTVAEDNKYEQQDAAVQETLRLEWDKRCCFQDGVRQIDYVLAYEEDVTETEVDDAKDSSDEEEEEGGSSTRSKNSTPVTPMTKIMRPLQSDTRLTKVSFQDAPRKKSLAARVNGTIMSRKKKKATTLALKRQLRRKAYLDNLTKMGLQLEHRTAELGNTKFVLVHAPFELLEKQAQLLSVKLPVRRSDVDMERAKKRALFGVLQTDRTILPGRIDQWLQKLKIFEFDEHTTLLLNEPDYFTAPYSSDRRQQFVNWDRPDLLFPNADRCRMVYDMLIRARYDTKGDENDANYRVGIERLLGNSTFSAAYPLHQEFRSRRDMEDSDLTQRELLYTKWASWRNFFKYQPLDLIKRYFGTKVALYFAWLGYYTKALYPAALIGIFALLFGIYHVASDYVSNDICGQDGIGVQEYVCPHCIAHSCNYQKLQSSCLYAKVSFLFDNTSTVIFAVFMSVWATLFLEGWKRYHAEVAWKWGLMDFVGEEESVRPEFQLQVKTKRYNPITQKEEPFLSFEKKLKNVLASGATVLFFILLVLAVVFGMMVYRVIAYRILNNFDNSDLDQFSFLIVSGTAATLNMIVIFPMNAVYNQLAHYLTRWECPRTQADFDNQYTFKVFLFQFVNYYSSLFYIAFFKGALWQAGYSHADMEINTTFTENPKKALYGFTFEGCDSAGCFAELVIQLAIIMCGKQFVSAFMETLFPKIMSKIREYRFISKSEDTLRAEEAKARIAKKKQLNRRSVRHRASSRRLPQALDTALLHWTERLCRWEADYYLTPVHDQFLFDEYLEMVLQFGFVTLFVAAFPLAPLFAVLNNIMEIRLDAYKFLVHMQRPLPAMAKNIGVWLPILDGISKCSVTINALVIAFTSDFVPRTLYYINNDGSMAGYVNSSLSYFNTSHFASNSIGEYWAKNQSVELCRYRGYFKHPCRSLNDTSLYSGEPCSDFYEKSEQWWHILAFRLLFVVIFEHVVFVVKSVIAYLIPDIPTKIFIQQQRERYLARQALIAQGSAPGIPNRMERRVSECGFDSEDTAYQPGSDFAHPTQSLTEQDEVIVESKQVPIVRFQRAPNAPVHKNSTISVDSFTTAEGSTPDISKMT